MIDKNEWETPQWFYNKLNYFYKFDIDLCATGSNRKCLMWCKDYLADKDVWRGEAPFYDFKKAMEVGIIRTAWMCPPFSYIAPNTRKSQGQLPFVQKAFTDAYKYGIKIVMLLKCDPGNRTWEVFYDMVKQKPRPGVKIEYMKRIAFEYQGKSGDLATFPTCLVILNNKRIKL